MNVNPPSDAPPHRVALLAAGLRPFFLLAAAHAVFVLPAWMALLHGVELTGAPLSPLGWHSHEMVFGFVAAAMAGFLLTAVPSWTKSTPIGGAPLLALVALWLAGRAAMTLPLGLTPVLSAAIDIAFSVALAVTVLLPVARSGNRRNYGVVVLLTLLAAANAWFHLLSIAGEPTQPAARFAINGIALMLVVVGGRIVPAFTTAWLRRHGASHSVAPHSWLDVVAIAATAAMLVADLLGVSGRLSGSICGIAALALVLRLARWQGHRTLREPIVLILHVGYAWLPVAFALKAASLLGVGLSGASWTHALTAGAFSTMILAVMSRAALGHTGRPIVASSACVAAYVALTAAALTRVFGPVLAPAAWTVWLAVAGLLYVTAFALFLLVYVPILLAPRVDGQPG